MRLACTYFPPHEKARGKRFATTWERLCARFERPAIVGDKHAAPGVSLATFRGDHRSLKSTERVYAVGIDLDEAVPAWDDLVHYFSSHAGFVHSTWSSEPDDLRARVFLLLSRPVSADEYRRVYRAVVERAEGFGLVVDRAASDPSRFWYLPSKKPDALYCCATCNGRPVNVDWALHTVPPAPAPIVSPPTAPSERPSVVERARSWLAKRDPAIQGSKGDPHTFATAVCIVRGFDLDESTSFALLSEWNRSCRPPWNDQDLLRKVRKAREESDAPLGFLRDAQRGRS